MFDLTPASIISRFVVFLVAMAVHEYAHAYAAYTQGDTTAHDMGRMTLDPRANIYWPGFLFGLLFGFAVLGSAPVNQYRMRNPRWGMFIAVLAGPVSNLLVAAVFAVPFRLGLIPPSFGGSVGGLAPTPERVLTDMVFLNLLLFVFNILPLAPLDGWTVTLAALPTRAAIWWQRHQQHSTYILFGLIILSFLSGYLARISPVLGLVNILNWLIGVPVRGLFRLLTGY